MGLDDASGGRWGDGADPLVDRDVDAELTTVDVLGVFERERPRLMGTAYRILGTVSDAEDVLQEAWLRWSGVDPSGVGNAQALLTTIVSRLSLDRLRRLRARREVYPGPWLPEPVIPSARAPAGDPEAAAELADSLSMALLVVLETLSPLERAAFVLREIFQRPYPEVAEALQRREPAVRQLVRRARRRVDEGHTRFATDRATHSEVVRRFMAACLTADVDALMVVLAPDVAIISDGGGVAPAPRHVVHGRDRVVSLLVGILRKLPEDAVATPETFNGALGIVVRIGGEPVSAMALRVAEGAVQSLQLLANPDKLWPFRATPAVPML